MNQWSLFQASIILEEAGTSTPVKQADTIVTENAGAVASDLFRRHDISGWAKALWVIVLVVAPYIGVFAYLIFQGRGMTERNVQQAHEAREELRRVVGFSAADEIEKLDRLKKAGSISEAEFARLRAKLV